MGRRQAAASAPQCTSAPGMDRSKAPARQATCSRLAELPADGPVPILWSAPLALRPNATFENERPFAARHFHRYLSQLPAHSGLGAVGGCDACGSCAVVGASGSVLRHRHGTDIDSHELVLRPNWLKLKGYEEHVGRRTSLNVIFALENMLDQFLRAQRKLPPAARAIGLATPSSPRGINSYFRYLGRKKYNLSHPGVAGGGGQPLYLLSDALWRRATAELCAATGGGCLWPTRSATMRPSSGFFAVLVALEACRNVSLYGFTSDACLPFHYYGPNDGKCRGSKPGKMEVPKKNDEPVHWFDKEHEIYARWVNEGRLRVFS